MWLVAHHRQRVVLALFLHPLQYVVALPCRGKTVEFLW